MKSEDYIKILDENLQLPVQNLDLGRRFTFQQYNDTKSVTAWLPKNNIIFLLWFSLSLDLNFIKKSMARTESLINRWREKNLQEFEHMTVEEWNKIPEKTCSNLTKIFWKRLQ